MNFSNLPNGRSVVNTINNDIANYNAYTSACAAGGSAFGKKSFGQPVCGETSNPQGLPAGPCYVTGSSGETNPGRCGPKAVVNPYWNAPVQSLLNPNADYPAFDVFPGTVNTASRANVQHAVRRFADSQLQARSFRGHPDTAGECREPLRRSRRRFKVWTPHRRDARTCRTHR